MSGHWQLNNQLNQKYRREPQEYQEAHAVGCRGSNNAGTERRVMTGFFQQDRHRQANDRRDYHGEQHCHANHYRQRGVLVEHVSK